VYADSLGETLQNRIADLEGAEDMTDVELVDTIANIAVPAAILCLIVLVVYGGYMLISSQGNPDKLREGREVLTNAIIGFFIVVLSIVILLLISNSLDLNIYN
jgi:heme/copper-type cytochrome/quinol oxidase subunit 2